MLRLFLAVDAVAHVLYAPTMLGRSSGRSRWHHRIHLIPGWLLRWVCDGFERWLGVPEEQITAGR